MDTYSHLEVRHPKPWQRTVKVNVTIYHNLLRYAIAGERIAIPDHEICVLSHFNRAYPVLHANNPGWIQGNHLQGFFLSCAAVAHRFCRLLIEPPRKVIGIALNRHANSLAHGDHSVPGDCVPCLVLIAPPVGKCGDGHVTSCELVCNLVCLQRMMERPHFVSELLGDFHLSE